MEAVVKQTQPLTSTEPSKLKLLAYRLFHILFGWMGRLYLKTFFNKVEVEGTEHLKGGGKLVLMNHSNPLDPVLITFFGRQPLQFFITEAFMQGGFASKLASAFGQISKRKLDMDTTSIKLMKAWLDLGANAAMFPEGLFSWDGKPSPLMQGVDMLTKFMNVPVVIVKLTNGDRVKPAWAKTFRKTSIKISIQPPKTFEKGENVLEYLQKELHVDCDQHERYPVTGDDLSYGLKKLLRYCPHCSHERTLVENQNTLSCIECNHSWEVTPENILKADTPLTIGDALNKTYQKLDTLKNIVSSGDVEVLDLTKLHWSSITKGALHFDNEVFTINDWKLNKNEILAHTLDWGDLIILKTRRQRIALKMPNDSRAVWTHLLNRGNHEQA
jgi:1-acyl-sn-glycerol-3-phosphate acyltransferase